MNSICFDTETTGLHPNGSDPDEILTISIIGRDGSVLLDERFRPTVKTEWPHASAVNGIYPEDVADLPTIETAIPRLREIFAGADEIIWLQRRIRLRIPFRRRGAPERGCNHHGHHGNCSRGSWEGCSQVGGCRRPHRIRVDGQGAPGRLPTRSRHLPCSDGSNNGS